MCSILYVLKVWFQVESKPELVNSAQPSVSYLFEPTPFDAISGSPQEQLAIAQLFRAGKFQHASQPVQ
jgi:hypothetical protein